MAYNRFFKYLLSKRINDALHVVTNYDCLAEYALQMFIHNREFLWYLR